jgi:hypothetical protein
VDAAATREKLKRVPVKYATRQMDNKFIESLAALSLALPIDSISEQTFHQTDEKKRPKKEIIDGNVILTMDGDEFNFKFDEWVHPKLVTEIKFPRINDYGTYYRLIRVKHYWTPLFKA